MKRLSEDHIRKCRNLRRQGYSLGDISVALRLPKSTLFAYVMDIFLSSRQKAAIEDRRKEKNRNNPDPRKGKCLPGREIKMPQAWSDDLVHAVAHFMFDGRVDEDSCIYYSKDMYQIQHMRRLLAKLFKVSAKVQLRDNGVYGLIFCHVELAAYLRRLIDQSLTYVCNGAPISSKRIFLQAFFDDEGNVYFSDTKRRVRGYQQSRERLKKIKDLLLSFGIVGTINKHGTYIEVSDKNGLNMFAKHINFSPGIYLNPKRKNSLRREKISKRKLLELVMRSYAQ